MGRLDNTTFANKTLPPPPFAPPADIHPIGAYPDPATLLISLTDLWWGPRGHYNDFLYASPCERLTADC
jgi:hypothetical protein